MADSAGLRQRKTETTASSSDKTSAPSRPSGRSSQSIGFFDIVRVLLGLALVSTLGSYLVTSGKSYIWGLQQPWWTRPDRLQAWWEGPILLTNEELAAYDGSDPSKPILLAINRTIYDVSQSPRVYGKGGAYSSLAAKDASRSYITTCFDPVDDLVPYLGGVEEVYVPLWLSKNPGQAELDAMAEGEIVGGMGIEQLMQQVKTKIGRRKVNQLQKEAYEEAKGRVRAQIKVWEGMFAKKNYPIVGKVVGVNETDPRKYATLKFCEAALKQRPSLADSLGRAMEALGHEAGKIDIGKMQRGSAGGAGSIWADVKKQKKAQEKRDSEGKDGKQAKDEVKAEEKIAEAAHQAVDGDASHNDRAKASIDDMIKGGRYNPDDKAERKKARDAAKQAAKEKKARGEA